MKPCCLKLAMCFLFTWTLIDSSVQCAFFGEQSVLSRVQCWLSGVQCAECSWLCGVQLCSRRRRVGCGGRIRPAASHYLLHSAAQPSHLNCIQPTGFPQHTAHNVPFYVSFSKLSPPRIGANGEQVALESTKAFFFICSWSLSRHLVWETLEVTFASAWARMLQTETLPATSNDELATWWVSTVGILDLDRSINCLWWILLASVQVLDVTSLRCRSLDLSPSPCIKYLLPQWQHV